VTELGSIYIEFDSEYSEREKQEIDEYFRSVVGPIARTVFRQDVSLEIHLEDGSLKVALVIAGSLYMAIGAYGSFRSGLKQIKNDIQVVSSFLQSDIKKNGYPEEKVISINKESSVASKALRLLRRIEKINRSDLNDKDKREIELIQRNIDKLLHQVSNEADRVLVILAAAEADKNGYVLQIDPNTPERPGSINRKFYVREPDEEGDNVLLTYLEHVKNIEPLVKEYGIEQLPELVENYGIPRLNNEKS